MQCKHHELLLILAKERSRHHSPSHGTVYMYQLEFYRTHTLCALISTGCSYYCRFAHRVCTAVTISLASALHDALLSIDLFI